MMKKIGVIETLDQLPEEFNVEELVEKRLFTEKVEKGLQDAEQDNTMSLQEAKQKIRQRWKTQNKKYRISLS
ncbi:MAG: hypothetical protein ACLFT3_05150 [Cyclobacteriaceae bacterium]